jgi:hypothetical protein
MAQSEIPEESRRRLNEALERARAMSDDEFRAIMQRALKLYGAITQPDAEQVIGEKLAKHQ